MSSPIHAADAPNSVEETVRDLETQLRRQRSRRWWRRLIVVGVIALIIAGIVGYKAVTAPAPKPKFTTVAVEKRDIFEEIQSSGAVKPLTEVQVGAQVSGRVVGVHVDFNTRVKKGDLLAEIDPSLFGAQVSQSRAQLQAAKANVNRAEARITSLKARLERTKALLGEDLSTESELEQVQGEYDVARADLSASQAQLSQLSAQLSSARTTLDYTKIYSPIDGVVINRAVDPGQTVAASFAAPTLFVIAEDLSKMQVLADIDEADVGKLTEGMKANVVVDAFPETKFPGKVTQVRYSPKDVQGVITYSAVINVENPDQKLRPGMTATVTIRTREAKNAVAVKNAALRFKPLPELDDEGNPKPETPPPPLEPGHGRVYRITGGQRGSETIEPLVVDIGITDGVWTALEGDKLKVGAEVVTEQREEPERKGFGT